MNIRNRMAKELRIRGTRTNVMFQLVQLFIIPEKTYLEQLV